MAENDPTRTRWTKEVTIAVPLAVYEDLEKLRVEHEQYLDIPFTIAQLIKTMTEEVAERMPKPRKV